MNGPRRPNERLICDQKSGIYYFVAANAPRKLEELGNRLVQASPEVQNDLWWLFNGSPLVSRRDFEQYLRFRLPPSLCNLDYWGSKCDFNLLNRLLEEEILELKKNPWQLDRRIDPLGEASTKRLAEKGKAVEERARRMKAARKAAREAKQRPQEDGPLC